MLLELTTVRVAREAMEKFEAALPEATAILSGAEGYLGHQIRRCADDPRRYILMVNWRQRDDASWRFQESGRLEAFRSLLSGFYEDCPETSYYVTVAQTSLRSEAHSSALAELPAHRIRPATYELEPTA